MHADSWGWIGVDLDGTLAKYEGWIEASHIGEPVPAMLARVQKWISQGKQVKIFTARVGPQKSADDIASAHEAIRKWTRENVGTELEATATKDFKMTELWDDRCVQVERNTGLRLSPG